MTDKRNPKNSAYRAAQLAARERSHSLSVTSVQRIDTALLQFANDLEKALLSLGSTDTEEQQRRAIQRALQLVNTQVLPRVEGLLQGAVAESRRVAFSDILAIQTQAAEAVALAHDIPNNLLGGIRAPAVSMAGAWESLGSGAATWKTLLAKYSRNAAEDVQLVVTNALLSGMGAEELAKRLRPYVRGAEPFQQAFKGAGELTNKMLRNPAFKQQARQLRYNAARIAFSETQNARAEAETQSYAADPMVSAVRWELSPFRGTQDSPDACDGLAFTDWYGLGPGIYPVTKVPINPHPFCRCERVPVSRPSSEAGLPKPNPARLANPILKGMGCGDRH